MSRVMECGECALVDMPIKGDCNQYCEIMRARKECDMTEGYRLAENDAYSRGCLAGIELGKKEAYDDIEYIIGEIEQCCIDHTENECGEWETLTVDYSKWADVFVRLRQLKEQKNERMDCKR